MSPKKIAAFRLDTALLEAMRQVRRNDGIPVTTQIEMAVREWLARRGAFKAHKQRRGRQSKA